MTRILVLHLASGRAAFIRDTGAEVPRLARVVPVVSDAENVESLGRGPWSVGEPACWSCGFAWVSVAPTDCPEDGLECLRCGEMTGSLPVVLQCGNRFCSWKGYAVTPPDAPRKKQCWKCRQMPAVVVPA